MNVNNLSKSQYVYDLIKEGLDASSLRSKVIANNVANLNTKDYKAYYVSFEENLKKSIDDVELKTTNERHIKDDNAGSDINVEQDLTSSMNQDGNNVDIDNQMANQAANNIMYNALISQINSRISLETYIIKDGRG
ncbi:flagellar basal body rod protein FlgB [Candidatus Clostridium radicumherbarum]|uniref:Flagellar basal body rod protein FlgB n=1 Tax=Candidatus Clostridium radicumherbarum TaxID=3381662 RepID=A0ABW8TVM8_9CLOT